MTKKMDSTRFKYKDYMVIQLSHTLAMTAGSWKSKLIFV